MWVRVGGRRHYIFCNILISLEKLDTVNIDETYGGSDYHDSFLLYKDKLILCSYYLSAINQLADVFDAYEQNDCKSHYKYICHVIE